MILLSVFRGLIYIHVMLVDYHCKEIADGFSPLQTVGSSRLVQLDFPPAACRQAWRKLAVFFNPSHCMLQMIIMGKI